MSRIGNLPISVPSAVNVEITGDQVAVSGPQGTLNLTIPHGISLEKSDNTIVVKRRGEDKQVKSLHGLIRSLINNMVVGVEKGWTRQLELVGVGYRAQTNGMQLTLNVGYSHPVVIQAPEGVKFAVADNTKVTVAGFDRQKVGQVAAHIRGVKPPEPYQGKGIRYAGEYVRRKAGKAGKAGAK